MLYISVTLYTAGTNEGTLYSNRFVSTVFKARRVKIIKKGIDELFFLNVTVLQFFPDFCQKSAFFPDFSLTSLITLFSPDFSLISLISRNVATLEPPHQPVFLIFPPLLR